LKAPKTSGGGITPVRHTIPLGIVIFLVGLILNLWDSVDLPGPTTQPDPGMVITQQGHSFQSHGGGTYTVKHQARRVKLHLQR